MGKLIIEGNDRELDKLVREQRIRVQRGDFTITRVPECDCKYAEHVDSKEVIANDTKDVPSVAPSEETSVKKTSKRTKKSE